MAGLHFTGVIRDFSITHPDFDESESGSSAVTGLVSSTLSEDGTPAYIGSGGAGDGGNDTLAGGAGIDSMSGGAGADRFVFASSSDIGNATHDTIGDFAHKDIIDLTGINTDELGGAGFTVVSAFGGNAGELVVTKGLTSATLSGDIDGDGTADFVLDVGGVRNLHADDLVW